MCSRMESWSEKEKETLFRQLVKFKGGLRLDDIMLSVLMSSLEDVCWFYRDSVLALRKNTVEYLRVMEYIAGKRYIEMRQRMMEKMGPKDYQLEIW